MFRALDFGALLIPIAAAVAPCAAAPVPGAARAVAPTGTPRLGVVGTPPLKSAGNFLPTADDGTGRGAAPTSVEVRPSFRASLAAMRDRTGFFEEFPMPNRISAACLAALLLASGAGPVGAQGSRPYHGSAHGDGGRGGIGRARAAVYDVIAVSAVTDAAGLKATLAKLGPSLAGTGGRLLVDADQPTALAGSAPTHLVILVFDDALSASRWQTSPAFKSLAAELAREGTLQVSAAGGIADPGAAPAVPAASLDPAPRRTRLPQVPRIADICKGC